VDTLEKFLMPILEKVGPNKMLFHQDGRGAVQFESSWIESSQGYRLAEAALSLGHLAVLTSPCRRRYQYARNACWSWNTDRTITTTAP